MMLNIKNKLHNIYLQNNSNNTLYGVHKQLQFCESNTKLQNVDIKTPIYGSRLVTTETARLVRQSAGRLLASPPSQIRTKSYMYRKLQNVNTNTTTV